MIGGALLQAAPLPPMSLFGIFILVHGIVLLPFLP